MQKKTTFSAWLSTFVFCFLFWLLLTWSVHPLGLLMDAIFSAAVAAFTAKFFIHSKAFHFFNPARFFALIAYIFVFFWEMVKANLSMVGIVLTGKRNHCQSGIIRVPGDKGLTSEYGLAMISNCITMTPGTITVDVAEDEEGNNYYYVHWIDVAEMDREKAGDIIKGTMEKWIGRIWK